MPDDRVYWFPAKRLGWGWGPPQTWQGRAVIAAFVVLAIGAVFAFPPEKNLVAFLLGMAGLCGLLFAICFVKGEPPRWRWGGE